MMGHQPPTESGFDAITSTYDDIMRVNEKRALQPFSKNGIYF